MTRSLRFAYSEQAHTLNIKHLKAGAFSASRINKIKEEASHGFRRYQEESGFVDRQYLVENNTKMLGKSVPKKSRVGQRQPKRDSVGVNLNDF